MLTDADKLLIAAAVCGTATDPAVVRLLAASADARAFAAALADDRRRLAALPWLTAPAGFADGVDAALPIIRPVSPHPVARRPGWLPYAVAAGVCAAVAVGSYQLSERPPQPMQAVAHKSSVPAPQFAPREPLPERLPPPSPVAEPPVVADRAVPAAREVAPSPRPVRPPALLAAGLFREIEPPAELTVRPPLLVATGDLDTAEVQVRAMAAWSGLTVARIDLFVPDAAAALPAVQATARSCGWTVSTDAAAQALLRAKQPGTFALYTEGVSATDGAKFLAGLAAQQRGGAKLGQAHLSAVAATDLRELRELFGDAKPPVQDDSTVGQVVKQLAVKRPALVFATAPLPSRPTANSKDVRAFSAGRSDGKPGGIPLLVVVRSPDGP